jgi:hypothetical protein
MSAENNLGGQFLTVYRGVREHPDRVRTNFTGTHWTTSLDVAKGFATDINIGGKAQAPHGTVIEAEVHHDDVVKPHTKEWYDMGGVDHPDDDATVNYDSRIFPPDHDEAETTLKYGASLNLKRLHHFELGKKIGEVDPGFEPGGHRV